jgi:hypothetical protein
MGTLARVNTQLMPQRMLSEESRIVIELARLNTRRQAKIGAPDLQIYAEDLLTYGLADVTAALNLIARYPREEGETAFPAVAVIVRVINVLRSKRRSEQETERRCIESLHQIEHPEDYIDIRKEIADFVKRYTAEHKVVA